MSRFVFILLIVFFGREAFAVNSLQEILESDKIKVRIAITDDSTSSEREDEYVDSILKGTMDPGFQIESTEKFISKGYTRNTIWVLIRLKNDTNKNEFILNLNNSHLDTVELYKSSSPVMTLGGDNMPHSEWPIQELRISFPLEIPPGQEETILLKIKTTSAVNIKPSIQIPKDFYKSISQIKLLFGLFYGSVGIMIIYNFIIFLIIREKVYFYYSTTILANLVLQMFLNGTDLYWMGEIPSIRNNAGILFVGTSAFFGIMFAREFLHSADNMSKLDKVLKSFAWLSLGVGFLFFFFVDKKISIIVSNLIAQIFSLLTLYAIIRGMYLKVRQAKLFFVAWGFLLIGIILYALLEAGLVPYNSYTLYANQVGSMLEATILSLAMAERLRSLKREKEKAQEEAFQNLGQVVQERTHQLHTTLNDIQKDIQMAKRIQTDTLPDVGWTSDRIKFSRIFKPMSIIGGDTFDLTKIRDGYYRIFLADATGHGVQAALITMAIRSEYQAIKRSSNHPGELLLHLNATFMRDYFSLNIIFSCCVLDIDTRAGKAYYSGAGHPPQLFIQDKKATYLEKTGRIIGLSPNSTYTVMELNISPQDKFYLYSDGLLEQENAEGVEFGEDRLEKFLVNRHFQELDEIMNLMESDFQDYRGKINQMDDLTVLGIEVKLVS